MENPEIMAISNKYKDTLNALLDSSDLKSLIGWDKLMKSFAMPLYFKVVQRIIQKKIDWIKISQTVYHGNCLKIKTYKCINAMLLHLEQGMERVRGKKKTVREIR